MKIITIDKNNIDIEHFCCAIGNDKENKARAETKKIWMKQRFDDGLVFKRLDERGKIFIEYMPVEKAWKPVIGENYMLINCLWVSGKFKGQRISIKLLSECINDAKEMKMDGIVVVTSSKVKPFMTDKKFYEKFGFKTVDTAPPYFELMSLKFNDSNKNNNPYFTENAKKGTCFNKNGFTFIFSNQCPFMEEYINIYTAILKNKKIDHQIKKINSSKDAKEFGSPFGTLGIYYNGKFMMHELLPEKKFEKLIEEMFA